MRRDVRPPLPAVLVLDPRMYVAAMLLAPWDAVSAVQCLDAPWSPASEAVRDGVCWAIAALGARTVVRVTEGNGAPPTTPPDDGAWRAEPAVSTVMEAHGAAWEDLWCDRRGRRLYRWRRDLDAFVPLDADATRRLHREVRLHASPLRLVAPPPPRWSDLAARRSAR
ncbi:MAG: hypothetical protein U0325_15170 [Polyangiales bacterium]